jgi:hypothetical protein
MMMQMLTGQDARRVVGTVEAALERSKSNPASFQSVIDPRAGAWPVVEAAAFAHLAARCASLRRADRPDIRTDVLPCLMQLRERALAYPVTRETVSGAPTLYRRLASIGSTGGSAAVAAATEAALAAMEEPPSIFVCPITQEVMSDPVFASDGYTYEREAIAAWITTHNTSPMTNLPLLHPHLTPNHALRSSVREWLDQHPSYAQAAGLL